MKGAARLGQAQTPGSLSENRFMHPALSRILICRTDNIGDVVLTLPLAGFLKGAIPGVQVDMVCRA